VQHDRSTAATETGTAAAVATLGGHIYVFTVDGAGVATSPPVRSSTERG
jgi:hypothetical protein